VNALSYSARFIQEYFINNILSDIVQARGRIFRRVRRGEFFEHMDNFMCHNGRKVTDELVNLKLDCVPHPPYSPDLSLCDFWLFEMLKQKIENRVFQTVEEIKIAVYRVWDELILDDLQPVFFNCIERLECVSEHGGEYYTNSHQKII
jgi:histone-lysine N-methyltransferase SETMAR